jgi:hypothetical protein
MRYEPIVSREFHADNINAVVNDPSVRPWVGGGTEPLDLAAAVADIRNVLLMTEGGGVLFMFREPGIYEAHTQFIESARGASAVAAVQDALRWMFTVSDAVEIQTRVPANNRGALGLVQAINGEHRFNRRNAWPTPEGMVDCAYYALTIDRWAAKAPGINETGVWFHDKLEAAKIAAGATSPIHDDDEAHDRYVGATCEIMMLGMTDKALRFYNRFARFSGYGEVSVIAINPVVVDIGDALIAVRDDDFDVLLCR